MAIINKPRIVKDYDKLPLDVQGQIKLAYPQGFAGNLITYINAKGKVVSALPYETDDHYYLVRMTLEEANNIVENDDDFNDDGVLRDDFALQEFEGHDDVDEDVNDIPDDLPEEEDDDDDIQSIPSFDKKIINRFYTGFFMALYYWFFIEPKVSV